MRKIDKLLFENSKYKKWLDEVTIKNYSHPKYNSSNGEFYYSIIANLLFVQQGLCAYTERRLQDHLPFKFENWQDGLYNQFQFSGQLDHYDALLKTDYGWLWKNFFLIDSDVNVKMKRSNKIYGHLKPDNTNYDPINVLQYDIQNHIFIPNKNLDFKIQQEVLSDIKYLGLNFQPIIDIRREYLQPILDAVKYHEKTYDKAFASLNQFFTAFEFSKNYMDN